MFEKTHEIALKETVNSNRRLEMPRPRSVMKFVLTLLLTWGGLQLWMPLAVAQVKKRVFVHAQDSAHKQAIKAVIGDRSVRHDYVSTGSEGIFSAELTRGQIRAVERLGGRVEPVTEVYPVTRRQHHGALSRRVSPQGGKPVCGDGVCHKKEKTAVLKTVQLSHHHRRPHPTVSVLPRTNASIKRCSSPAIPRAQ